MQVSANGSSFKKPDPGTQRAVLTRIIDLGTQDTSYKGTAKKAHKVMFAWELEQKMEDGRPFLASNRFTASLHEKAVLTKFLEGWRGRSFTDEERNGFDLTVLLGQPCLLTLVQDGEYVNVSSAVKMPKGMEALQPVGPLVMFDLTKFDANVYASFSDGLKATIAKSPEYDKAVGGEGMGTPPPGDSHDDIPF
jgi:hypothetical protein